MSNSIGDIRFWRRAREAYRRHCNRNGFIYEEPTSGGEIDGDTITLSNIRGTLARYRWTGTRVERLEEES